MGSDGAPSPRGPIWAGRLAGPHAEVEGQRTARAIPHDELLETGGELAVGMAHNDLISLDPELLK